MKNLILFLSFFALAMFAGCGSDETNTNIPLVYEKCPCEREAQEISSEQSIMVNQKENILLFDNSKITDEDIKELTTIVNENGSYKQEYIVCDFVNQTAMYIKIDGNWQIFGKMCNFPYNYAWYIPKEGLHVSFKAKVYEACDWGSIIPEDFSCDLILSSLKIK